MPNARQNYALYEHTSLQETETQLDNFLAQGQEILNNLVDQRGMLKGTHKRLLDAAHTIGLSRDVIGWIERRRCVLFLFPIHLFRPFFSDISTLSYYSKEDTIIFVIGAIITFFCFWLIWHYLG